MRRRGWGGDPPATDDEAVHRIVGAARACIDRDGGDTGIAEVARELGITRQTVYRYFRTTEDLLTATAIDAAGGFLARVEDHLAGREWTPAGAVVEGVAFTIERLPGEPALALLFAPGRVGFFAPGFASGTAIGIGRAIVDRFPVDWAAHGYAHEDLDDLVEHMLRVTLSFVLHPGVPPRAGADLRRYLGRWLAPCIPDRRRASVRADARAT